ncbi:MAG TPA: hypothetical protein VGS04_00860 [Nitrososphaerales archaeon]|nr:hypothetical protein [Nitrososphaerales archaeon]
MTAEASNSTLGFELLLTVNSTVIPSEDAITLSTQVMNTRSTKDNVTAANDWPVQGLSSWPCFGDWYPVGVAVLRGNYQTGNLSSGRPLSVWNTMIECPAEPQPVNVTSYSFLPKDDVVNYSGYFPSSTPSETVKEESSTILYFLGTIFAANGTGGYDSLGSALPSNYTLIAGDEWGQLALLHFKVTPSNLLPKVGNFLSAGCSSSPCDTQRFSGALVFGCAAAAATPSGCSETWSDTTRYSAAPIVNYTATVWYPSYNQPNEPASANCMYFVFPVGALGNPTTPPSFGYCLMVNSTSFVVSPRP